MSNRPTVPFEYNGQPTFDDGNTSVRTSLPISSVDWTAFSNNSNYLYGKGNELIPEVCLSGISGGINQQQTLFCMEYYVWPTTVNPDIYFNVGLKTRHTSEVPALFGFSPSLNETIGDISYMAVPKWLVRDTSAGTGATTRIIDPPIYMEYRLTPAQSKFNPYDGNIIRLTCTIVSTKTSEYPMDVVSIGAYQAPRAYLITDADNKLDPDSFLVRSPIYEEAGTYKSKSVYALGLRVSQSLGDLRRVGLWNWAQPTAKSHSTNPPTAYVSSSFRTAGASGVSGSFSNLSASVQSRRLFTRGNNNTNNYSSASLCDVAVLIKTSGSNCSGTFTVQGTIDTLNLRFSSGTVAAPSPGGMMTNTSRWITGSLWIRCDGSSGSMLPEPHITYNSISTYDKLGFKIQQTGSGAIDIYSICISEKLKGVG